jgi:hypothetical protein
VWTGNLFECASNEIILRHGSFESGITGECNSGAVTASSIGILERDVHVNSSSRCFRSLLYISANTHINNRTIACLHVDDINEAVIDTLSIGFTTGARKSKIV